MMSQSHPKDASSSDTITSLLPKCTPFLDSLEKTIHESGSIGKMDSPLFKALGVLSLELQDKIWKAGIYDLLVQSGRFIISDHLISLGLSNSHLNPHASEYNPPSLTSLNPNAKEYLPSTTVLNGDASDEEAACENWETLFDESEQDRSVAKGKLPSPSASISPGVNAVPVTVFNGLVSEPPLVEIEPSYKSLSSDIKQTLTPQVTYSIPLQTSEAGLFCEVPISSSTASVLKANTWKPTEKDVILIKESNSLGTYLPEPLTDAPSSIILNKQVPLDTIADLKENGLSSDSVAQSLMSHLDGVIESSKMDTKTCLYSSFQMPNISLSNTDISLQANKSISFSSPKVSEDTLEMTAQSIVKILARHAFCDRTKIIKRVSQISGLNNLGRETQDVEIQINSLVPCDNKKVQTKPLCSHFGAQVEDLDFAKLRKYKESLQLWTSDVEKYMAKIKDMYIELQSHIQKTQDDDTEGRDQLKNEILDFKIKNLKLREENDTLEERCQTQLLLLNDTSAKLRETEQKGLHLKAQLASAQEELSHLKPRHESRYKTYLEMFMLIVDIAFKANLEKLINVENSWKMFLQKNQTLKSLSDDKQVARMLKDAQDFLKSLMDHRAKLEEAKNSLKLNFENDNLSGFYQDFKAFSSFPTTPYDIKDFEKILHEDKSSQTDAPKEGRKLPPGFIPDLPSDLSLGNHTLPLSLPFLQLAETARQGKPSHAAASQPDNVAMGLPSFSCLRRADSNETLASTAESLHSVPASSHSNIYNKIITLIIKAKPHLKHPEIISYLRRFKAKNNNKLKGLRIDTIVKGVIDLINEETS